MAEDEHTMTAGNASTCISIHGLTVYCDALWCMFCVVLSFIGCVLLCVVLHCILLCCVVHCCVVLCYILICVVLYIVVLC